MKLRIALVIAAAVVTLSFTFASVKGTKRTTSATTSTSKVSINEPIGGFGLEDK